MAATIIERADFEIKSGNVFCTLHSFDQTSELVVFPITHFRTMLATAQRDLDSFDVSTQVISFAEAKRAATKRIGRAK